MKRVYIAWEEAQGTRYEFKLESVINSGELNTYCLWLVTRPQKARTRTTDNVIVIRYLWFLHYCCCASWHSYCDACISCRALRGSMTSALCMSSCTVKCEYMQHYYFARHPTDHWQLENVYSLTYFSLSLCLRGLCHIPLFTARTLHRARALCHYCDMALLQEL